VGDAAPASLSSEKIVVYDKYVYKIIFYGCSMVYRENYRGTAAGDKKVGNEILVM
jgi:hypothetical protein